MATCILHLFRQKAAKFFFVFLVLADVSCISSITLTLIYIATCSVLNKLKKKKKMRIENCVLGYQPWPIRSS